MVANRTAASPDPIAALRKERRPPQASFTLLVPAVPHGLSWAADMKAGWVEAVGHAERAAARIRQAGLELDEVIVGDPDPFAAVGDVLHTGEYDGVIVSVLPRAISRWLALGLPARPAAGDRSARHPGHRPGAGAAAPPVRCETVAA